MIPKKPLAKIPNYIKIFSEKNYDLRIDGICSLKNIVSISELVNNKNIDKSESSIRRYLRENIVPTNLLKYLLKKKRDYDLLFSNFKEIKGAANSKSVILPKYLSPELAYFIGALRDGSLPKPYNNLYEVYISQKNREWLQNIIMPIIQNQFGIKELKIDAATDRTLRIRFYSKPVYYFIKEVFDHPTGKGNWDLPKIIVDSPLEIKRYFLCGFFDAEGEVPHIEKYIKGEFKTKPSKRLRIHQSWSGDLCSVLLKMKKMLENDFQIKCGNILRKKEPHGTMDSFDLNLSGDNAYKFYKEIGSFHPDKSKRLNLLFWE